MLRDAGIETAWDLLYHFPRRYLDRSTIVPMEDLSLHAGVVVTVVGRVAGVGIVHGKRKRLVVTLRDRHRSMELVFFQGLHYWQTAFTEGEDLAVSGAVQMYGRKASMVHPDIDRLQDGETLAFINTGGIVPVYPSNAELEKVGLNRHGGFRKLIHAVLRDHAIGLRDWYDTALLEAEGLLPLHDAIEQIHRPTDSAKLAAARERLIFDEFFVLSLQLALRRRMQVSAAPGIAFNAESPTARDLIHHLPFELTPAQKRVLHGIFCVRHAAEHPVSDRHHPGSQLV